jgi:hypothetical protein
MFIILIIKLHINDDELSLLPVVELPGVDAEFTVSPVIQFDCFDVKCFLSFDFGFDDNDNVKPFYQL